MVRAWTPHPHNMLRAGFPKRGSGSQMQKEKKNQERPLKVAVLLVIFHPKGQPGWHNLVSHFLSSWTLVTFWEDDFGGYQPVWPCWANPLQM